jgi:hypothetical protein
MEGKSDAEKSNNCAGHAGHLSGVLAERNVSRSVLGGEGQRSLGRLVQALSGCTGKAEEGAAAERAAGESGRNYE